MTGFIVIEGVAWLLRSDRTALELTSVACAPDAGPGGGPNPNSWPRGDRPGMSVADPGRDAGAVTWANRSHQTSRRRMREDDLSVFIKGLIVGEDSQPPGSAGSFPNPGFVRASDDHIQLAGVR